MEEKIKQLLEERPITKAALKEELEITKQQEDEINKVLKKLKKEGFIVLVDGQRWALTKYTVCPCCNGKGWVEQNSIKTEQNSSIPAK